MKVVGIKGSVKAVNHITAGIKKHGDSYNWADSVNNPVVETADAFIQTNLLKPKFVTKDKNGPYEYILKTKKPFLVQESPNFRKYIDLGYQRLGWWSYKWTEGEFGNNNSPPDRWNKFQQHTGIKIKDWKSSGDKIIIMGQKPGDSSLIDLYNNGLKFDDWITETIKTIRKYSDREIIIRPHPRGIKKSGILHITGKNVSVSNNLTIGGNQGGAGLEADLQQAYCVVTYNSLSAIESICEGIPTFAMHNGSMIWPIAHKDLSQIENLKYNIDITQWCNDIAYTQWTSEEQTKGEAWAHLKPLIFKG
jgi:hypothetical protein